jgi:hypothetical protein
MGDDRLMPAGSGEATSPLLDQNHKSDAHMLQEEVARGPMRVIERGVYRGPHLYSLTPMIRIKLDHPHGASGNFLLQHVGIAFMVLIQQRARGLSRPGRHKTIIAHSWKLLTKQKAALPDADRPTSPSLI